MFTVDPTLCVRAENSTTLMTIEAASLLIRVFMMLALFLVSIFEAKELKLIQIHQNGEGMGTSQRG